ncbi:MAG TPA: hypothetical protein VHG08_24455 [Longimicrobium sp.]|nr:hypothetical protein [Longimicrobium sp.]
MNSPLEIHEVRLRGLDRGYPATMQRRGRWWIGWIDEVPGINSQATTRGELMDDLASALKEALEMQ